MGGEGGCTSESSQFRVQGSGVRAHGSLIRVQGSGFAVRVQVSQIPVSGFRVQGWKVEHPWSPAVELSPSDVDDLGPAVQV